MVHITGNTHFGGPTVVFVSYVDVDIVDPMANPPTRGNDAKTYCNICIPYCLIMIIIAV